MFLGVLGVTLPTVRIQILQAEEGAEADTQAETEEEDD
jgi:hypothetical protein